MKKEDVCKNWMDKKNGLWGGEKRKVRSYLRRRRRREKEDGLWRGEKRRRGNKKLLKKKKK